MELLDRVRDVLRALAKCERGGDHEKRSRPIPAHVVDRAKYEAKMRHVRGRGRHAGEPGDLVAAARYSEAADWCLAPTGPVPADVFRVIESISRTDAERRGRHYDEYVVERLVRLRTQAVLTLAYSSADSL
jgi:hypothetical protein